MSEFPRTLPDTIPADNNTNAVSVISGWNPESQKVVPIGVTMTMNGWAINTTALATLVGSSNAFFSDDTIETLPTSGIWKLFNFGFTSISIGLINDGGVGGATILYSFDGINTHGKLKGGERFVHNFRSQIWIYLQATLSGAKYRLEAY